MLLTSCRYANTELCDAASLPGQSLFKYLARQGMHTKESLLYRCQGASSTDRCTFYYLTTTRTVGMEALQSGPCVVCAHIVMALCVYGWVEWAQLLRHLTTP